MAASGVLLHKPFSDAGHPGKIGPSVGICRRLVSSVNVVPAVPSMKSQAGNYIGYSSTRVDPISPVTARNLVPITAVFSISASEV
jgi:hypothetical protein